MMEETTKSETPLSELLASLADGKKKPTKKDAQRYIKELADKLDDDGEALTYLSELYSYFMPTVPKVPKTAFDWVAKAMGAKDVRYYLNYVHVTEDRIAATDGHRLHVAPNTKGMEPGFYNKAGDKVHRPEFARFPDIDRVIPSVEGEGVWRENMTGNDMNTGEHPKGDIVYRLPNDAPVNKAYMDQALAMTKGAATVTYRDKETAIRIDHGPCLAVVMPLSD